MQLSEHFSLEEATFSEAAARHNIQNTPGDAELANMKEAAKSLEKVRDIVGKPITINSWFRSKEVNKAVGGSQTSAHCLGWAIDTRVTGMTPLELCKIVAKSGLKFDQIIHEYGSWMHISFDPKYRGQLLTKFDGDYKPGLLTKEEYTKA